MPQGQAHQHPEARADPGHRPCSQDGRPKGSIKPATHSPPSPDPRQLGSAWALLSETHKPPALPLHHGARDRPPGAQGPGRRSSTRMTNEAQDTQTHIGTTECRHGESTAEQKPEREAPEGTSPARPPPRTRSSLRSVRTPSGCCLSRLLCDGRPGSQKTFPVSLSSSCFLGTQVP